MSTQKIPRDPTTFEFTTSEREKIESELETCKEELCDKTRNLESDRLRIPGQNFAIINIVSPTSTQKNDKCCVKIKGVFDTLESANARAKELHKEDSTFDMFVVSLYEWLMIPPDMERITDQEYADEKLNTLISEYKTQQKRENLEFETRKDALKSNPDVNKTMFEDQEDLKVKSDFKSLMSKIESKEKSWSKESDDDSTS